MKLSTSIVPFLLLFLLVTVQGIRLEGVPTIASLQKIHEENERNIVEDNGGFGKAYICRDGQCSGMSRKLMTKSVPTSESSKSGVESKGKAVHPSRDEFDRHKEDLSVKSSEHGHNDPEHYPDIMDIAGMDYSPARRKPPIHN